MPASKSDGKAYATKEIMDAHHKIIAAIKPRMKIQPPVVDVRKYMRLHDIIADTKTYLERTEKNIALLVRINEIMRTLGSMDTFTLNTPGIMQHNNPIAIARVNKIDRENMKLAEKFLGAKHLVETGAKQICEQRIAEKKEHPPFELPHEILKKYSKLNVADDIRWPHKYFRPLLSLDLEVKDIGFLGKIVLELYTEACPDVVLEFVKLVVHQEAGRVLIKRVFTELWLDCEVVIKEKESPLFQPFEYDMRAIDHSAGMGILSIPQNCLGGFRNGNIEFNISLVPLSVLNGKRVAFGRVKHGCRVLDALNEYGSKNGKMIKEVVFSRCALRN